MTANLDFCAECGKLATIPNPNCSRHGSFQSAYRAVPVITADQVIDAVEAVTGTSREALLNSRVSSRREASYARSVLLLVLFEEVFFDGSHKTRTRAVAQVLGVSVSSVANTLQTARALRSNHERVTFHEFHTKTLRWLSLIQ